MLEFNALLDHKELIGKTISHVFMGEDSLYLRFTDGSLIYIESELKHDWDEYSSTLDIDLPRFNDHPYQLGVMLELGLITHEEIEESKRREMEKLEANRKAEEEAKERRKQAAEKRKRTMYERLKREFEG